MKHVLKDITVYSEYHFLTHTVQMKQTNM